MHDSIGQRTPATRTISASGVPAGAMQTEYATSSGSLRLRRTSNQWSQPRSRSGQMATRLIQPESRRPVTGAQAGPGRRCDRRRDLAGGSFQGAALGHDPQRLAALDRQHEWLV